MPYRHLKLFGCLAYVHVAKDKRVKLDPKSRPCIFLGDGDDEFGYCVWDLVDKKVFRSREVFMENKNITNWESEKKKMDSGSIDKNWLEDIRIGVFRNRVLDGNRLTLDEPIGFRRETKLTEEEEDIETGQDPESDSDEEHTRNRQYQTKNGDIL